MEMINKLMDYLGMDANNFYPMIIALLTAILSIIFNMLQYYNEHRKNRLLELFCKIESNSFYGILIIVEALGLFLGIIISEIALWPIKFLMSLIKLDLSISIQKVFVYILMCIVGVIIVEISKKIGLIRERLLGDKVGPILLYAPLIPMYIEVAIIMWEIRAGAFNAFVNVMIMIIEVIGLMHFRGRYVRYRFSSIRLYTDSDQIIECEHIENLRRKHNVLIINEENKHIRLKYDKISRAEYYGGPTVKLVGEVKCFRKQLKVLNAESDINTKDELVKEKKLPKENTQSKMVMLIKNKKVKNVITWFFKELFVGVIIGIVVVIATEQLAEREKRRELRSSLQTIALGENIEYINSMYGVPIISYHNGKFLNTYYKLDNCVLRCVYSDEESLIAYILTVNSGDIYKVNASWFLDESKDLRTFSYEEFHPYSEALDFECSVPANNDDFAYYQEIYYGAGNTDYNYYIIGSYKDYEIDSHYDDLLALYVTSRFKDDIFLSSDEYHSIRKELCPNTFGMVKSGYEKDIDIIDDVEEVRIYGDILFGDWR